jgi:hypothetical protein
MQNYNQKLINSFLCTGRKKLSRFYALIFSAFTKLNKFSDRKQKEIFKVKNNHISLSFKGAQVWEFHGFST